MVFTNILTTFVKAKGEKPRPHNDKKPLFMINYIMEITPNAPGIGLKTYKLHYPDELTAKACFYETIKQLRWARFGELYSVTKDGQRILICKRYH